MEDILINIAAVLALILPIFSVWAAISMYRISRRHPKVTSLRERSNAASILAFTSVLGGLVGLSRLNSVVLGDPLISREVYTLSLVLIILLTSVPNVLWVIGYKAGNTSGRK